MSRKSALLTSLIITLSLGAFFYYRQVKKKVPKTSVNQNSAQQFAYLNLSPAFHPDSVTKFEWKISNKTISFDRQISDFGLIQDYLNLLSITHHTKSREFSEQSTVLQFGVTFSNGQRWDGAWNGKQVYWTSGLYKDLGTELIETHQLKFLTGALIKRDKVLNFCSKKISDISLSRPSLKISDLGGKWMLLPKNVVATDKVERWLSQNCQIKIDSWLDESMLHIKATRHIFRYNVNTTNQIDIERVDINELESNVFKISGTGSKTDFFVSSHLNSAITELNTFDQQ
jgi:hypothetical protein